MNMQSHSRSSQRLKSARDESVSLGPLYRRSTSLAHPSTTFHHPIHAHHHLSHHHPCQSQLRTCPHRCSVAASSTPAPSRASRRRHVVAAAVAPLPSIEVWVDSHATPSTSITLPLPHPHIHTTAPLSRPQPFLPPHRLFHPPPANYARGRKAPC